MLNLVGMGGGTGLPVLLLGLRQFSEISRHSAQPPLSISAIVCVSDNGGSSGHLRQHFGIPAVGDLRNCLVALSDGDSLLADLFQYRFSGGNGLNGHSLGNLIVTAFCHFWGLESSRKGHHREKRQGKNKNPFLHGAKSTFFAARINQK